MPSPKNVSWRQFVVDASSLVLAGATAQGTAGAQAAETSSLALHGGKKATAGAPPLPTRWGEPERERLDEMIGQNALFYWKGPQTTLLKERFQKICPVDHVQTCSSGWADIGVRSLEIVCLNFTLDDVKLVPQMRKPFSILAKGPEFPGPGSLKPGDFETRQTPHRQPHPVAGPFQSGESPKISLKQPQKLWQSPPKRVRIRVSNPEGSL